MAQRITALYEPAPDDELLASWRLHMKVKNLAAATVYQYERHVAYLAAWLALPEHGGPRPLTSVTRRDIVTWLGEVVERTSGGTGAIHYRTVRQLYRWLLAEGEIAVDPFVGVAQPRTADTPPKVLSLAEVTRLIATCAGRSFEDRRDDAMIRLMVDAGPRRGGIAAMAVAEVGLDTQTALLHSKGKEITVPYGVATTAAIDRYLRLRRRHPRAALPALWLGPRGALTGSGIYQMIRRRAARAGLTDVHPHVLRHTFAHHWLVDGGQESDLMALAGWSTPQMIQVYGRSARAARAQAAHKTHGLGDRL